jgi:hypothetical protein
VSTLSCLLVVRLEFGFRSAVLPLYRLVLELSPTADGPSTQGLRATKWGSANPSSLSHPSFFVLEKQSCTRISSDREP